MTHAEDGFTLQSAGTGQSFLPFTPMKKAVKRDRRVDESDIYSENPFYQVMQAKNSFVILIEKGQIVSKPDIQNKFLTQYQIISNVGQGSFGIVYKCRHISTG